MRRDFLKDLDSLEYSAKDGFYDKELDMEFRYIGDWLKFKYGVGSSRKLLGKDEHTSWIEKLLAKVTE